MTNPWITALTSKTKDLLVRQPGGVFPAMTREVESTLIRCALAATGGCRLKAARLLGIGRNTIARKIQAFGLGDFATPSRRNPRPQNQIQKITYNPQPGESHGEIEKNGGFW